MLANAALAVGLANNANDLARIKDKLARHRKTKPLFNTSLFVKHLEYAYEKVWQNFKAGDNPEPIRVPEIET